MSILTSPGVAHAPTAQSAEGARAGAAAAATGEAPAAARPAAPGGRPVANGKFFFTGTHKFYVRGVTYGPFGSDGSPAEYGDRAGVARDFARIAASGFNALRVYS